MRKQRLTERMVRSLLRTILSRKTLKTGEAKQMTIRSLIGMSGIAARQQKLIVETLTPYMKICTYRRTREEFCSGIKFTHTISNSIVTEKLPDSSSFLSLLPLQIMAPKMTI